MLNLSFFVVSDIESEMPFHRHIKFSFYDFLEIIYSDCDCVKIINTFSLHR